VEGGSAWIPSLLWRFDMEYKGLRREVPWLKRLPSEYFASHVWVTTQPLEVSPQKENVVELLRSMSLENRLVYSSDYPHWVADEIPVLACPWHGWEFELERGHALWDENYALKVLPVSIESGRVLLDVGRSRD